MKWLMVAGLVYFFLPYDLFPDLLGLAGRIDDILILSWIGRKDFISGIKS